MKPFALICCAALLASCGGADQQGASGPAPAPIRGVIHMTWTVPPKNVDGSNLTNIAGYRVHYGDSADALVGFVSVGNVTAYTIGGLTRGTPYFVAVSTINALGQESERSAVARAVAE